MTKQDLKNKWGKYCDTDKLVTDMMSLLKKYRHRCTEHGVCELLDKYFKNKESLIKIISSSKNYIGDMRISIEKEFERKISPAEINVFFASFYGQFNQNLFVRYKDDNGKTFNDYLDTGKLLFDLNNLPSAKDQKTRINKLGQFDYTRQCIKGSLEKYNKFNQDTSTFRSIYSSTLQRNYTINGIELKSGTKTSRAFNKICVHHGVDKLAPQTVKVERNGVMVEKEIYPYDKLFARYSDLVSGLVRKSDFIISVNPLDYLMMSNGVSWRSCHMIDGGMYQGGCLSYLLDKTSIATFVIDKEDKPIHLTPRLYRQMIHYDDGMFMQNRLYPQGNDGATNLYEKFRDYVAEEFSELLNVERKWKVECGYNTCGNHVSSSGKHYKDYLHNDSCAIFYLEAKKDSIKDHVMRVGHDGICPYCGETYSSSNYLAHSSCKIPVRRNHEEEDWDWIL